MDNFKAKQYHEQMLKFISKQGNDKVASLSKQGEEECAREKAQYIAAEKERIVNDYKTKLAQDDVKLKI
jgi:hypothetical protein